MFLFLGLQINFLVSREKGVNEGSLEDFYRLRLR